MQRYEHPIPGKGQARGRRANEEVVRTAGRPRSTTHGSTNGRPGPYDQGRLAGNHKGKKAQKRIEATPFENEVTRDEPPSVRRQQQGPGQTRHEVRRRRRPWRQPGPRSEVARDPHEARRVRSTRGQPVRRVRGAEGTATDAQEGATRPNRQRKGHVRP